MVTCFACRDVMHLVSTGVILKNITNTTPIILKSYNPTNPNSDIDTYQSCTIIAVGLPCFRIFAHQNNRLIFLENCNPMPEFVHLHNHTHYSLLDAACTPDQLIQAAKEDGQKAIALTDHGVMFGCFEFYKKAKNAGIKPILGCEVYIANGSRFDKGAGKAATKKRNYFHLVLLAKNDIGYKNLMKLTTLGHTEGFYYRPRIDTDLLEQYHEGLIALSACLAGVINAPLLAGDYETARKNAIWYKNLFGDDFYIELQNHGLEGDEIVMTQAPRLAEELDIKLIVSNDCHYIKKNMPSRIMCSSISRTQD
ncbi:MAG: PHP domain-containing protein [Ignavibacteria bacterium]|nr:PHP domain-containing protein [Ignavibacteria bacterium]